MQRVHQQSNKTHPEQPRLWMEERDKQLMHTIFWSMRPSLVKQLPIARKTARKQPHILVRAKRVFSLWQTPEENKMFYTQANNKVPWPADSIMLVWLLEWHSLVCVPNSLSVSVCLLSVCLSTSLSNCLSDCLVSNHLSAWLPVFPSAFLPDHVHLSTCYPTCLSVCSSVDWLAA